MAKSNSSLYQSFQPTSYEVSVNGNDVHLVIKGRKMPPPSKRVTLHQKKFKIISARITQAGKKSRQEMEVGRINHLPTLQQVRLHTSELIYPGPCEIILEYKLDSKRIKQLKETSGGALNRELIPSIDEPEAWKNVLIEFK